MQNNLQSNEITWPMRINRYLAFKNYASRREADVLIAKGAVLINGRRAQIGDKVQENDVVTVDTRKPGMNKSYVYYAYNKPKGIVTHSPEKGQRGIADVTNIADGVFPLGRLDRSSRGLILLSNDGRITDKLLNPEREHEKEYVVTVNKPITNIFLKVMRQGVQLEDFKTRPCVVEKKDDTTFTIILTEGKKHQIRRMCAALGWAVHDLKRVRVMNIKLGNLASGKYRKIQGPELETLLASLGIVE